MRMTPELLALHKKAADFREIATNPQARAAWAESRGMVILPMIPTQSTIRNIFTVEQLLQGNTLTIDIPFEDTEVVFMLPQVGGYPTAQVEGKQMSIDTFIVGGGIEFQEDIALDGRFQVGDRSTFMLMNHFVKMEELCGWSMILNHAAVLPSAQKFQCYTDEAGTAGTPGSGGSPGTGRLTIRSLNRIITIGDKLGIGGRRVVDLYVSPERFNDLRNAINAGLLLPDSVKQSLYGDGQGPAQVSGIRIHRVWNPDLVSDAKGYAFTYKEGYTYGIMPIRNNVETRDDILAYRENKIGIRGSARYGFGVLDDKGLIEVTF